MYMLKFLCENLCWLYEFWCTHKMEFCEAALLWTDRDDLSDTLLGKKVKVQNSIQPGILHVSFNKKYIHACVCVGPNCNLVPKTGLCPLWNPTSAVPPTHWLCDWNYLFTASYLSFLICKEEITVVLMT